MPFIIGDKFSIPIEYRHYYPIIRACLNNMHNKKEECGKIGYLSIKESFVSKGLSHRRPGIHTDRAFADLGWGHGWGGGNNFSDRINSGIFLASTQDDMCRVWNTKITDIKEQGDCEYLRDSLGDGTLMKKNQLFWITDRCPHESLLAKENTYRQWFRFVSSDVGIWYANNSTPNSLGIVPPPECKIIGESKFFQQKTYF